MHTQFNTRAAMEWAGESVLINKSDNSFMSVLFKSKYINDYHYNSKQNLVYMSRFKKN